MRKLLGLYLLVIIAVGLVSVMCLAAGAGQEQPSDVIRRLNASLLESMKMGPGVGPAGRSSIVGPVVRECFALDETARAAAGRYWETFNEEQRKIYLQTYADWTVASYAGRFNEFSGEKFVIVSESPGGDGAASVVSRLIPANGFAIEFNYQLRRINGHWRIVDIKILGISQLLLTRGQFFSIIRTSGHEGLIRTLNEKIARLSREGG